MKQKRNTKSDLIWIIPVIIGELFLTIYIPLRLLMQWSKFDIFSITALLYLGVIYLLLSHMKLSGLYDLVKVKWRN